MPKSRGGLTSFLGKDCLNKDILISNRVLRLTLKTRDSQFYQRHDVALFGSKNEKT